MLLNPEESFSSSNSSQSSVMAHQIQGQGLQYQTLSSVLESKLQEVNETELDEMCEEIYDLFVEELTRKVCFEVHRSVKMGVFSLLDVKEPQAKDSSHLSSSNQSGQKYLTDVFGQTISSNSGANELPSLKKQPECICPNCQRNMAASRFAPHLEKCMGAGRNSSRLASRRLANNSKDSYRDGDGQNLDDGDDAEDEDWVEPKASSNQSSGSERSKRKRDKNSPRRNKGYRKNGDFDGSLTPPSSFDQLSIEERSNYLSQICGVMTQTTSSARSTKICTRSTRCNLHTDTQRREVRIRWLSSQHGDEEAHVDIDTFSEGDTLALRESLALLSNASSPAESTISTSSNPSLNTGQTSGRNRRENSKRGRGKKGRPGSKCASRGSTPPLLLE